MRWRGRENPCHKLRSFLGPGTISRSRFGNVNVVLPCGEATSKKLLTVRGAEWEGALRCKFRRREWLQ